MIARGLRAELRAWRRVRLFAVPPGMIALATARRLAGDWRGACAAAGVDVDVDPAAVSRIAGSATRERVADDLRHLVPDLLRWHQPRAIPHTGLLDGPVPLAVYERGALEVVRRFPGSENQRLVLRFAATRTRTWESLVDSRERWDDRHTAELAAPDPEMLALSDGGDTVAAFTAAGFDMGWFTAPGTSAHQLRYATGLLRDGRYDMARLAAAVRATALREGTDGALIAPGVHVATSNLRVSFGGHWPDVPLVPMARMMRPVDFDLVRAGLLAPHDLHPLVAAALFPSHVPAPAPPAPDLMPVRVWCRGEWHLVEMRGGAMTTPHAPEELPRELALHALGGPPPAGCFAAVAAWRGARLRLPKHLRLLRRDVVERAVHGDTAGLSAWLAAGLDPALRDGQGRTMLHMLSWLPSPAGLLLELVAAGLDLEARDELGRTPLLHAVAEGGTAELIQGLLALGASADGWEAVAQRHGRDNELWPVLAA